MREEARPYVDRAPGGPAILLLACTAFVLVVSASRPLRPLEHQLVLAMIPQEWRAVRMFADAITRR